MKLVLVIVVVVVMLVFALLLSLHVLLMHRISAFDGFQPVFIHRNGERRHFIQGQDNKASVQKEGSDETGQLK